MMPAMIRGFLLFFLLFSAPIVADAQALRVFGSDFRPYAYEHQGRVAGTATDRVREILAAAGEVGVIEIYPWARAYRAAKATPGALLYPVARTPERENDFIWLGELVDYDVRLWRLADRTDIAPTTLGDIAGLTVGGLTDDVKTGYLQARGVPVALQSDEETLLTMLVAGRIDLMPADRVSFLARLQRLALPVGDFVPVLALPEISQPLYLAITPGGDPALVRKLAAAFSPRSLLHN